MNTARLASLEDWTRELVAHREALLRDYAPYDLHQFRVRIRRIRSLLKYGSGDRERSLRADWRALFVQTNAARDWDVFTEGGGDWLGADDWRRIGPALRPLRDAAREQAMGMLRSRAFGDQLRQWRAYLDSGDSTTLALTPGSLEGAIDRVRRCEQRALTSGDRVAWHRLRVAVKKLRYGADTLGEAAADTPRMALIAACEALQDDLGAWHDHCVQVELLRSPEARRALADAALPPSLSRRAGPALERRRDAALAAASNRLPELGQALDAFRKASCR